MMRGKLITIFGGSGFLGRYVIQALAKEGARLRIAVRYPDKAEYLRPRANVGDIMPVYANVRHAASVNAACMDADYVINLAGILYESGGQTFEKIHIIGASTIAEAAHRLHVKRLIHVSAIGADSTSSSRYANTKGKGEQAVLAHYEKATILRPSVIFGEDDHFINRFAEMTLYSPFLPAFGGGVNKLQPVYVGDVVKAIVTCLKTSSTASKIYELGGPKVYTFHEILALILKTIKRKRSILSIPYWVGSLIGSFMQYIMPSILTADQVKLLEKDAVVKPHVKGFPELGLTPDPLEAIIPHYLERYKPKV